MANASENKEQFIQMILDMEPDFNDYPGAEDYFNKLRNAPTEVIKPKFTEAGFSVFKFMRENVKDFPEGFTAKGIADAQGTISRNVSGALRKLKTDGYLEKTSDKPAIYVLTEKGMGESLEMN